MSVFLSSGSPTRSVCSRAFSFSRSGSNTGSWTRSREPAQHTCPWLKKHPAHDALDGLVQRGVLEHDVRGLPPELQGEALAGPGDRAPDRLADLGGAGERDLVDVGADERAPPVSPGPVTMFTAPGGSSACWITSASRSAVRGVVSAGFRTVVFPVARRASFHAAISIGKFQGSPGRRRRSVAASDRERVVELVGPARVVEEVAAASGRSMSRDSLIGLPPSIDSRTANSRARSWRSPRHPVGVLRALLAGSATRGVERGPRRVDGEPHVLGPGLRDLGEDLLARRVDRRQVPAALRLDELAFDEQGQQLDFRRLGVPPLGDGGRAGRSCLGPNGAHFPVTKRQVPRPVWERDSGRAPSPETIQGR